MSNENRSVVRAFDFGTEKVYNYSEAYRFAVDPRHMHAPPNFTDNTAFVEYKYLRDAHVGDVVFIEWPLDRFYALDAATNEFVPGPTVWRKSKILEHALIPLSKSKHE